MNNPIYFKQAQLILDILPLLGKDKNWALKGGTAINFFIRDLPRLSVDIDLAYLPLQNREQSLRNIHQSLENLAKDIRLKIPNTKVDYKLSVDNQLVTGLFVFRNEARVKLEPNIVLRGSVFESDERTLSERTERLFRKYVKVQTLSFADLYGGKICAGLDRQHLRDIFDIRLLFENEGITEEIKNAFIVYLISHPRPMLELLNPNPVNMKHLFDSEFRDMTLIPVTWQELAESRNDLINEVNSRLNETDRRFLISVKSGNPDWKLFPLKKIKMLPGVQWKLINIRRMDKKKHEAALNKLETFLTT